jgi:hypothetical protein
VSDELKKFREIKKLKTENQITRLFEIFGYIVNNSKRTPNKTKEISETSTTQTSSEPATTSAPYFDKYGRYHAHAPKTESKTLTDNSTTESSDGVSTIVYDFSRDLLKGLAHLRSNEYIKKNSSEKTQEHDMFKIMTGIENWCTELFKQKPNIPNTETGLQEIVQRKITRHMGKDRINKLTDDLKKATVNDVVKAKYMKKWNSSDGKVINAVLSLLNELDMYHDMWKTFSKQHSKKTVQREVSDTTTSTEEESDVPSSTEDDSDSEEENDKYF